LDEGVLAADPNIGSHSDRSTLAVISTAALTHVDTFQDHAARELYNPASNHVDLIAASTTSDAAAALPDFQNTAQGLYPELGSLVEYGPPITRIANWPAMWDDLGGIS